MMAHVDALAALLVDRYGVAPGDRVAIGMRNYPEWVIALRGHHVDRRDVGVAERVVDRRRARLRPRRLRRHRAASPTSSGPSAATRTARPARAAAMLAVRAPATCPTASTAGRTCASSARRCPTSPSRPTTTPRSSTPRAPPGTPRAPCRRTGPSSRRSWASAARPPSTGSAGRAAREAERDGALPPAFILIVPLFHVTGCVPVMLSCWASRAEARDHVQVGRRPRARADRARAGHELRRRPDPELGPARVASLRRRRTRRASSASAAAARRPRPSW